MCCNSCNRCCRRCCCGCAGENGGAVTLPSFPSFTQSAAWPVYVSVPVSLRELEEENDSSCGCCRG